MGIRVEFPLHGAGWKCLFHLADKVDFFAGHVPNPLILRIVDFCRLGADFDSSISLEEFRFGTDPEGVKLMHRRGITSGMMITADDDSRLIGLEVSKRRYDHLRLDAESLQRSLRGKWSQRRNLLQRLLPVAAVIVFMALGIGYFREVGLIKPPSKVGVDPSQGVKFSIQRGPFSPVQPDTVQRNLDPHTFSTKTRYGWPVILTGALLLSSVCLFIVWLVRKRKRRGAHSGEPHLKE